MEEALALSRFGPYRVEARIGSGGMGVVYRGRHVTSGEAVAVKTIQVRSAELIAAFRREVQVLAGLSHPGIVRVLDQGLTDGTPWYAMELVEGRPLSSLLHGTLSATTEVVVGRGQRTAPLAEELEDKAASGTWPTKREPYPDRPSLNELLKVIRKVCVALGFVHSHGLVHRDLKPENILIQANGNPVLVDFGVVGQFSDTSGREVLELVGTAGTLAYMAPEQALGSLVDARADLFSLGCILYECIVGEPPFGRAGLYDPSVEQPPPPSKRAAGVSPELDELVINLLARDLRDRLGYAEDVALALDRILNETEATPSRGNEPVYLYRPEFAGRRELLNRLSNRMDDAKRGSGSITLVSGESGLGKTRLLLELGARAVAAGVTVITGECQPVGAVSLDEGARGEPLHPFRNFLLAVADACRVGGVQLTERLLAKRGAVLAPYEPALAAVLGPGQSTPEREPPERARARVFWALEGLLAAFSEEQPLLLLLDDLQWADSLSLEFLSIFAGHVQARSRVTLVATFRSEETSDELSALAAERGVELERLERFDSAAVGQMVSGLLALRAPPGEWVSFLEHESGGNPFFIAEYLRAAIAERLLTRTATGRWTLGEVESGASLRDRLGLPATIGALVGRRLSGLDTECLQMVWAAAVLGREFDQELLAETAGVDVTRVTAAYGRLRQRQILEDEASGGCSFVHDKLREVAYGLIGDEERRRLHQRAAETLTRRREAGVAQVEAGTLGYHQAQAGNHERASAYFEQAGEAARRNHANRDALRYFRLALGELERAGGRDKQERRVASSRLRESLADVLFVSGELEEARAALVRAIEETPVADRVSRARRRRLLARTWERQHHHERALELCAQAQLDLGEPPRAARFADDYWYEWVQIQIQTTWHLYFLSRVAELTALLEQARPVIERRGSALQRAQFSEAVILAEIRAARYRVTDASVGNARTCLTAAEEADDPGELAIARFFLAWILTLKDRSGEREAEPLFRSAIAYVERVGDASLQARFIAYYCVMLRRANRVPDTRATALRVLEIAEKHRFFDYLGLAHANLCWVALQTGGDVEAAASQALAAWGKLPAAYPYPFQWLARIPLATHLTKLGKVDEALQEWALLLDAKQHLLPDPLSAAIRLALTKRASTRVTDFASLQAIAELAEALSYV
ncbi:MAG TPA: protein kinase [Polyangiaceae bacterium]|nr:protein kinase [Polyangiaceae bacterium]